MTSDTYLSAGNRLSDREKVEVIEAFFRASRNLGLRLIHHRGDADNPRHAAYLAERLDIKDESVVQQFLPRLFQYSLDLHPDTGIDPRILSVIEGSYDQLEKGALAFVGTDQEVTDRHARAFADAILFAVRVLPECSQMSLLWRLSDFMRDKPGIDQRLLEELKSAGHATFRSDITTWNIFKRWVWNRWYAPPKQPPQLEIIDDDA